MERIYVTYGPVAATSNYADHMALHYLDSAGVEHILEAGPQHPDASTVANTYLYLDELPDQPTPWGTLVVSRTTGDGSHTLPEATIAQGGDLSAMWSKFNADADKVEREGYNYTPTFQNSDSFVSQPM
jgi:hypothetical protein